MELDFQPFNQEDDQITQENLLLDSLLWVLDVRLSLIVGYHIRVYIKALSLYSTVRKMNSSHHTLILTFHYQNTSWILGSNLPQYSCLNNSQSLDLYEHMHLERCTVSSHHYVHILQNQHFLNQPCQHLSQVIQSATDLLIKKYNEDKTPQVMWYLVFLHSNVHYQILWMNHMINLN